MQSHTVINVLPGGNAFISNGRVDVHPQNPSLVSKVFDGIKNVSATIMANATVDNACRAGFAVASAYLAATLVESMSADSGHAQQHRYVLEARHYGPNQAHVEALGEAYARGFLDCFVQTARVSALAGRGAIADEENPAPATPPGRLLT